MRRWIPPRSAPTRREYPERRRAAYDTPFGIAGYPPPVKSALEATEEERLRAYEAKWAEGGSISFLYSYTDLLLNKDANETASEFVRQKIRATVKDPRTAELLCPNDHPIGTKRLILDTDYYETYNRDNVTLVDVRSKPIQEITPTGLRTADAEYALDAIVFATGFDAMTGAMKEIDIHTDAGMSIRAKWEDGPRTYLGLMIAGFPNLFMITGPQSPGVKSQMILACEQHVDWIADCVAAPARPRATRASRRSRRPRTPGCSTTTRSRTARSIRWRTHGTSAPTSRANRACSCRMSAASPPTRRNAMRSRPTGTKAFALVPPVTRSVLRQIDHVVSVARAICPTILRVSGGREPVLTVDA